MTLVKAAVVHEKGGRFALEFLQLAEPGPLEVLVRIQGTGLCHTDLSVRDQKLPFRLPAVLGHEGAGIVEKTGAAVTRVKPGDAVVLSFASCGRCDCCHGGRSAYCLRALPLNLSGGRGDGSPAFLPSSSPRPVAGSFFGQSSFADFALTGERNLVRIPSDVPVELMGPMGCSLQTGAGTVMNVLKPAPASSLVVFGAGAVGLAAIMAARATGCGQIVAVDLLESRLALARELGATDTVHAIAGVDTGKALRALVKGGFDHAIDCTAVPQVLRTALEATRVGGSCALVGAAAPSTEVSVNLMHLLAGRTLRGVTEGDSIPELFIPQLIALWRAGRFPFDRLVRFYDLAEINEAVADVECGSTVKAILRPSH